MPRSFAFVAYLFDTSFKMSVNLIASDAGALKPFSDEINNSLASALPIFPAIDKSIADFVNIIESCISKPACLKSAVDIKIAELLSPYCADKSNAAFFAFSNSAG